MLSCHLCLLISGDSLVFLILSFDCSFCLIAWYLYFYFNFISISDIPYVILDYFYYIFSCIGCYNIKDIISPYRTYHDVDIRLCFAYCVNHGFYGLQVNM